MSSTESTSSSAAAAASTASSVDFNKLTDQIYGVWFDGFVDGEAVPPAVGKRWFMNDPSFDSLLATQFKADLLRARDTSAYDGMMNDPKQALALIILLDQLSRNIFRGSADAFNSDAKACKLALEAISKGYVKQLPTVPATFLYLPLMHSENVEHQKGCIAGYQEMLDSLSEANQLYKSSVASSLKFAKDHAEIIFKFGRFPHRNAILGRTNTQEEEEHLKTHKGW